MIELVTTIEMLVDMSDLPWVRVADCGEDITYKLVHANKVYYAIFNTLYETVNGHVITCVDSVTDCGVNELLSSKSLISSSSMDMCERFNIIAGTIADELQ